jgi:hypothetical protein
VIISCPPVIFMLAAVKITYLEAFNLFPNSSFKPSTILPIFNWFGFPGVCKKIV